MFVTAEYVDAVDKMSDRLDSLEKEVLELRGRNEELMKERDLCMREVMRLRMLLDTRRRNGTGHA